MPNPTYKLNVKPPHLLSLIVLSAFASMGAVLITPALPNIAQYFQISAGSAQFTVTSFLLGYALGQLFYGPIANRFGRKPAFYLGIAIATIGSLFSIVASPVESFSLLILGRFLEAFGSSVGLVVCFTIINDFYYPEEARKMIGFMTLSFAIVPGIAVTFGGLLTQILPWQSCFYVLLLYGLVLIYPAVTLPETITQIDPHALHSRYLIKNYWRILRNRRLMLYAAIYGCTAACNYLFTAAGPFIGIKVLHLSYGIYGLLALIPYLGTALGSVVTIRFSQRFSALNLLRLGMGLEISAVIVMLLSFAANWINVFSLFAPMFFLLIGHALLCANASILAINSDDDKANASAMVSFVAVGTAVLMTFILGLLHNTRPIILPIFLLLTLFAMVWFYQRAQH